MISADFLAGVNLDDGNTEVWLQAIVRVSCRCVNRGVSEHTNLLLDLGCIENVNGVQSPVDR